MMAGVARLKTGRGIDGTAQMNNAVPSTLPILLGFRPYEWLTLLAIVVGPIVAVCISLIIEARRRSRDQRLHVFRIIMTTRHLPGDPGYSSSINLVPVEFHRSRDVINAYNEYIESTRFRVQLGEEDKQNRLLASKQAKLIFEMANDLGFRLRESDLEIQAYAADGFIKRDNIVLDAFLAIREVAEVLKVQTQILMGEQIRPSDPPTVEQPKKEKGK
jgi:hypothetical protein